MQWGLNVGVQPLFLLSIIIYLCIFVVTYRRSMTQDTLIAALSDQFKENFAAEMAAFVIEHDCVELLYNLAAERYDATAHHAVPTNSVSPIASDTPSTLQLSRAHRSKLTFRAAYTLETIYFYYPECFTKKMQRMFMSDFALTTNESAKRHFTKIMTHMLLSTTPTRAQADKIAHAAALWATESKAKCAVVIGAINVLHALSGRVDWIREILPDMIDAMSIDPSPAIRVRIREWRGTKRQKTSL